MFKNKSKFIIISTIFSLIVSLCFLGLCIYYYAKATNPNGESLDGLYILLVIIMAIPTIVSVLSFIFNLITFLTKKIWGAIVSAVITTISTIYFIVISFSQTAISLLFALVPLAITICSILGAVNQKKINNT
jgi:hypothetical protein